jgi:6-pyruvoyltetrahydropterin/6-carboxytetrahydropterin synthase
MYELRVEREFCAAHAITMGGEREPVHGHNWRVTVVVAGEALDAEGLLCDFHDLERRVDQVIDPLRDTDLNCTPPFDEVNPTAEQIARHIADALAGSLPDTVRVDRVSVTEAPGCEATYRMAT